MFENGKPVPHAPFDEKADLATLLKVVRETDSRDRDVRVATGGGALRAIEWRELTARLNAARELRRELRREAVQCAGPSSESFGDAAASYFKALGHGERDVNLEGLGGCKASCGTTSQGSGAAAKGDARDDI
ncbi:MAG: hypothetical protein AAFW59_01305 [Pseudomonadota bacterium]